VDIPYILIGKVHFDYMCILISLLILGGFLLYVDAIFMSVFLKSFVVVLVSGT
jgi:hypothetical protein